MTAVVQGSIDSTNWVDIGTNTLQNGISYFSDPGYTNYPSRIYRAKRK
jgi:hypothetical protein